MNPLAFLLEAFKSIPDQDKSRVAEIAVVAGTMLGAAALVALTHLAHTRGIELSGTVGAFRVGGDTMRGTLGGNGVG